MKTAPTTLRALATLFALLVLLPVSTAAADTVVVSAAASLRGAFEEIGALVAGTAGAVPTVLSFGASGELVAQIRGGAPVDVFAAAASKDMDGLEALGLLRPGTRADFAANEIVLVVPIASTAGVASFADLAKPGVARLAACNPRTSPAGRYADEVFASVGIAAAVRPKLVLAENVRQVLDYAARGEVDAGVVYATDAGTRSREVKIVATAPAGSHEPVIYPIAALKGSTRVAAAAAFLAAVRSAAGQAILARYGFQPAPTAR